MPLMQRKIRLEEGPVELRRRRIAKREDLIFVKFGVRINRYCEYCGEPAGWDTFKAQENIREFNASGYCQKCQDEVKEGRERKVNGLVQEIPTKDI